MVEVLSDKLEHFPANTWIIFNPRPQWRIFPESGLHHCRAKVLNTSKILGIASSTWGEIAALWVLFRGIICFDLLLLVIAWQGAHRESLLGMKKVHIGAYEVDAYGCECSKGCHERMHTPGAWVKVIFPYSDSSCICNLWSHQNSCTFCLANSGQAQAWEWGSKEQRIRTAGATVDCKSICFDHCSATQVIGMPLFCESFL